MTAGAVRINATITVYALAVFAVSFRTAICFGCAGFAFTITGAELAVFAMGDVFAFNTLAGCCIAV